MAQEKEEWLNKINMQVVEDKDDLIHDHNMKRNIFFHLPY
jgi:hypothetical protein